MKTSDILPQQTEDPRRRLAKALALKRLELPAVEFIVLYNDVRQEVAPSLNQVDSVRYLPQDVMDLFLEELDKLKHPEPEPLPARDQKAMELGNAILKGLKIDPESIAAMVMDKLDTQIITLVDTAVEQARAQITAEITDEILSLMVANTQSNPTPTSSSATAGHQVTSPPAKPAGMFKVMIVDSMFQKIGREVELQKPANIRLDIKNADHNPPSTLPRPHFFLISNRTPAIWVQAFRNMKNRMIDMGDKPGTEAYVEQLSRISQLPWFEA